MAKDLAAHPDVAANLDLFCAWTEARMAYRGLPGLSAGVVYDQQLVWSRGFGWADVEAEHPAAADTIYRIASITKTFTAVAVLQLRDEGRLQLDDPVEKHLPYFRLKNPHKDTPEITIRHLLTHSAGLPREGDFPYWSEGEEFPDWEQVVAHLPEQELPIPPGSDWKYSNLGLALAGEVVAAVSGRTWASYVEEQILKPLGLESTFAATAPADHPRLARGYRRRLPDNSRSPGRYYDTGGIAPAANMASTVEDLAQWIMLQFRRGPRKGRQVLKGSTLAEMHRPQVINSDWSAGRGLGWHVWRIEEKTIVGHGGALEGYRTECQFCPEDKVGFVVLTNADDGEPLSYVQKLFTWVAPALVKAAAPRPKPAPGAGSLRKYQARFRTVWGDSQTLVYEGKLVLFPPDLDDPKLGMITLEPVEDKEHTFRISTPERFSNNGELAVFEFDDEGKLVRLKTGANYSYPIESW